MKTGYKSTALSDQKHILIFIDWFLPGYKAGGPIQSIANLVERLPYRFSIVTSIYDHHSDTPYDLPTNTWVIRNDRVRVKYFDTEGPSADDIRTIIAEDNYDSVYVNSLFSPKYALTPVRTIQKIKGAPKVILAPRGMLKPGALSVKARKKKIFLATSKMLGWFKGIRWHATNDVEAAEVHQHFGKKVEVTVAPNLPRSAKKRERIPQKTAGEMKLITVARVSKEKNILGGIEYLANFDGQTIQWDVYGTMQDEAYLQACKEAAAALKTISIDFKGEIPPSLIPEKFNDQHFFYLPTLGENFGHAIAEALLSGVPVIISDMTPWQDLANTKAGWAVPLKDDPWKTTLTECLNMDHETYLHWTDGAYALGSSVANDETAITANKRLFEHAG
ncbi:glycosyltransferase [Sanyastnella coralliicola]|uniref:glycosyltransferase n=1 Tax=Sanyastnella coralliicola TaxID=3069118 RepID=UPI0027B9E626|nr:glycosyltransferase [Longitalea sp. SCSIO 12813]